MKLSYDEWADNDFEGFEKFTNSRRSMREPSVHDKSKGQAIRTRRKERESMKAEQEKANQEEMDG